MATLRSLENFDDLMGVQLETSYEFEVLFSAQGLEDNLVLAESVRYPIFDYELSEDEAPGIYVPELRLPSISVTPLSRLNMTDGSAPILFDETYFEQWARSQVVVGNNGFVKRLRRVKISRFVKGVENTESDAKRITLVRQDEFECFIKRVPDFEGDSSSTSSFRNLSIELNVERRIGRTTWSPANKG